ncbi:MAG: aldo/keto reductase [Thermoplasmata archaeon]
MINKKEIGHTGEFLFPLGLGTYNIKNYQRALESFQLAIEAGVEIIDTAEIYGTEDFVKLLIEKVGRNRLFIVTKIWPDKLYTQEKVEKAALNSLKRMNVNYVDLMLIHWPNREISIEEQIKNFEIVIKKGYTRYIGVSNFNKKDLEKAIKISNYDIQADEIKFSVIDKDFYYDTHEILKSNKISILAYTPIERGMVKEINVLNEIAKKYDKTMIQISLNYLINKELTFPIPKAENKEHMSEILGSLDFSLENEDIKRLDEI